MGDAGTRQGSQQVFHRRQRARIQLQGSAQLGLGDLVRGQALQRLPGLVETTHPETIAL